MKYKHVFSICAYKDSPYLEPLIRSLVSQSVPSHIILCTSTPSPYIDGLAWKYGIQVVVRHGGSNIRDDWNFAKEEQSTETIKEAVRAIRGVRSSMNVPPSKKATVYVVSEDAGLLQIFEHSKSFFAALGYAGEVILQENKEGIADDAVSAVIHKAVIYMPFADLVDIEKEIERLRGEEKRLAGELARSRGMLGNEKFVNRAPEAKIAEERAKLEKYEQMMEQVKIRLAQLQ